MCSIQCCNYGCYCVCARLRRRCALHFAAHKCNNYKGSIYMVFDYMDHDMTGLVERQGYKIPMDQVSLRAAPCSVQHEPSALTPAVPIACCAPC